MDDRVRSSMRVASDAPTDQAFGGENRQRKGNTVLWGVCIVDVSVPPQHSQNQRTDPRARDQQGRNRMGIQKFTMDIPMKSKQVPSFGSDAKVRKTWKQVFGVCGQGVTYYVLCSARGLV